MDRLTEQKNELLTAQASYNKQADTAEAELVSVQLQLTEERSEIHRCEREIADLKARLESARSLEADLRKQNFELSQEWLNEREERVQSIRDVERITAGRMGILPKENRDNWSSGWVSLAEAEEKHAQEMENERERRMKAESDAERWQNDAERLRGQAAAAEKRVEAMTEEVWVTRNHA